jgi:hypothetical protein
MIMASEELSQEDKDQAELYAAAQRRHHEEAERSAWRCRYGGSDLAPAERE